MIDGDYEKHEAYCKSLAERFSDLEEYLRFERIPEVERLHPNRTLCSYLKIASLLKNPVEFDLHAEHDIVYLAEASDMVELTDADIVYLSRCGIHYDGEFDCLADFC